MVSMKDIARRCGVSVATVRKALNGLPDIGEDTRRRICEAAAEMGYMKHIISCADKEGVRLSLVPLFNEYFSSYVQVENGVAKVNFTKEFADTVQNSDGGRMALKALVLTCTQFAGIEEVEILVEGSPYDAGMGELSKPTFANVASEIEASYIQTQSSLIFDFE